MSADTRTSFDRPDVKMEGDGILRTIASIAAEYLLENEEPIEPLENEDTQPDNQDADSGRRNELAKGHNEAADGRHEPDSEAKADSTAHESRDPRSDSELDDRNQAKPDAARVDSDTAREESPDRAGIESRAESRSDSDTDGEPSSHDTAEPELEEERSKERPA